MSDQKRNRSQISYFAAANTFGGFNSLFGEIFDPDLFTKIYILKGGPGTGKSTLMKRLIHFAESLNLYRESIYCSSDPLSLDGVIIEKDDKRIAVLDGTAPHTRDPYYPGAKDEIVNLQDSFIIKRLEEKGTEITELSKEKKLAYNDAYAYLSAAGSVFRTLLERAEIGFAEESFIADTVGKEKTEIQENKNYRKYYISAFGKDGLKQLREHSIPTEKTVSVIGDGISEFIAMKALKKHKERRGDINVLCPHPFSASLYDAVFGYSTSFVLNADTADSVINSSEYCTRNLLDDEASDEFKRLLLLSQKAFLRASECHMSIEKIYRDSVNFTNNDSIYYNLANKIEQNLGI